MNISEVIEIYNYDNSDGCCDIYILEFMKEYFGANTSKYHTLLYSHIDCI